MIFQLTPTFSHITNLAAEKIKAVHFRDLRPTNDLPVKIFMWANQSIHL